MPPAMRTACLLLLGFLNVLAPLNGRAQNEAPFPELHPVDWGLRHSVFFLSGVEDARTNRSAAGSISGAGPVQTLRFRKDLAGDLLPYLQDCLRGDTAKVGLVLSFDRFSLKETRTGPRRNIQFDFQLHIYRDVDGQRVQLYQVGGTPSYVVHGPNPEIYDRLIGGSLQQALSGFDRWAKENRNQPPLCKQILLMLADDNAFRDTLGDTLRWSATYRLQWPDFKGKPDQQVDFSANSACVFVFSTRPTYRGDTLVLEALLHPAFTKTASWVKPDKREVGLLGHEQLHFDICELYARRMRQRFVQAETGLLTYDEVLRAEFEKEWSAYQQRQAEYDRETEHGLIPDRQAGWQKIIAEELSALEAFSSR
jgi:hypothetical protein